jgi:hypothetical protein
MKQSIFLLMAAFLLAAPASAQYLEALRPMSKGNQNSFQLVYTGIKASDLEQVWSDYLNETAKLRKTSRDRKSGEIFGDDATIPSISKNTIDLYAVAAQESDKAVLTIWFDLGGAYLSTAAHADRMAAAKAWMDGISAKVQLHLDREQLKAEEARLKEMQNELKNIDKEQKQAEKEIAKLEQDLAAARQKMSELESRRRQKEAEAAQQEQLIKEAASSIKKRN